MITSLGEEGAGLCVSRAFVLHVFVIVIFSLPLGVGDWLRFVIMAFPGLFYELFNVFLVGFLSICRFLLHQASLS